jgi:hypothetical protein
LRLSQVSLLHLLSRLSRDNLPHHRSHNLLPFLLHPLSPISILRKRVI